MLLDTILQTFINCGLLEGFFLFCQKFTSYDRFNFFKIILENWKISALKLRVKVALKIVKFCSLSSIFRYASKD